MLSHCRIEWTPTGCVTKFADGTFIESYPYDTHHYHVIAHRCGYDDDVLWYCREHDFMHSFAAEFFHDCPSPTLWALAHEREHPSPQYEEIVVQNCQRWLRASERPIVSGVDWNEFKRTAFDFLTNNS